MAELDSQDSCPTPIELSDHDLEDVSGGLDLYFSGSFYKDTMQPPDQSDTSIRGSIPALRPTNTQPAQRSTGAFQFMGLGISSPQDADLIKSLFRSVFGQR